MACCGQTRNSDDKRRTGPFGTCWLCRAWCILKKRGRTPEGDPCVTIPGHLVRKPDPCIYSQFLLMQLNKPVTWDNPDVKIFRNGAEQYTYNLTADTEYDIEVTVHNASRDKPANGTSVQIEWIEFGAGSQTRHAISTEIVNVPVWPGTAVAKTRWRTPAVPGHYCIEVDLAHPDDGNPSNNRGWNNTQVHAANSPVDRVVRVFNRFPGDCPKVAEGGGPYLDGRRALVGWGILGALAGLLFATGAHDGPRDGATTYAVSVLAGYFLSALAGLFYYRAVNQSRRPPRDDVKTNPDRVDCHLVEITVDSHEFKDDVGKNFDPDAAFADTPPTWPAHVDPSSFVFLPGEAFRDVNFHTDAPDEPGPPAHFNVSVRQGGEPTGGVTFTITREGN